MGLYTVYANNMSNSGWTIVAWNYTGVGPFFTSKENIASGKSGVVYTWLCDAPAFNLYLLVRNGSAYKRSAPRAITPSCDEDGYTVDVQVD